MRCFGTASGRWTPRSPEAARPIRSNEESKVMTLERAITDYKAKTGRSRQLFEEALRVMPGGNSRTTTFFDPYPFYITRGQGPRIWDADGAERLDFNGNYTSLILGHAHPSVVEAVAEQATRGMSFPGPSEHEVKLAEMLTT